MPSISLIDIVNMEYSIGDKILSNNNISIMKCINETCTIFNEITKKEIEKIRDEYYTIILIKNIKNTIQNKMLSMLNNPNNSNKYNTPQEYDTELEILASQINELNYDTILENIICGFKDYVREYYLYHNRREYYNMFGIMMNEFYNFIKYHMKHEFKTEDFDEYDDDVCDIIINYKY